MWERAGLLGGSEPWAGLLTHRGLRVDLALGRVSLAPSCGSGVPLSLPCGLGRPKPMPPGSWSADP